VAAESAATLRRHRPILWLAAHRAPRVAHVVALLVADPILYCWCVVKKEKDTDTGTDTYTGTETDMTMKDVVCRLPVATYTASIQYAVFHPFSQS
jgi:hypothetical protein